MVKGGWVEKDGWGGRAGKFWWGGHSRGRGTISTSFLVGLIDLM